MSTTVTKYPISALPLPPRKKLLIHNLTPDTHTPSFAGFKELLQTSPSLQRRARILAPQSHFSHVLPFPTAFPYDIRPENPDEKIEDEEGMIEDWLRAREALHERATSTRSDITVPLRKLYPNPAKRDHRLDLIGISESGLRDCLPTLDVGDAIELLGTPSLSQPGEEETEKRVEMDDDVAVRQELVEVLGGHAVLMTDENAEVPFAPWSLRYSGHQFGTWAGQLGDGRAISIHVTPHPSEPDTSYELQIKGGGRTPFSRSADGLAVLRSSIREYLGAEAMNALRIPTTRSLSIVSLPTVRVLREREETASVVTRVAPSFIRIGNFEALNPPAQMFFLGGGQQSGDFEALRILGEWVTDHVVRVERAEGGAWGKELVLEVARRNAKMAAGWQAYGFMHGVINTDNVSILGLTIDYGPYAFMDVFDPLHICNHSDDEGRYAYRNQPTMVLFALRAFLNALAPLIGAEVELGGKAVSAGWAKDASEEKIGEWREKGIEHVNEELQILFQSVCGLEYRLLMSKDVQQRLGFRHPSEDDEATLVRPFLDLLHDQRLDFHLSFRHLTTFRTAILSDDSALDKFVETLFSYSSNPEFIQRDTSRKAWADWFKAFAGRVEGEEAEWEAETGDGLSWEDRREKEAKKYNPRFVLRQWVLEEVIKKVEGDLDSGKRILSKVMQMACEPFEAWGAEGDERSKAELDPEVWEERRLCGTGDKKMLGFQCSCSS
ncbi:hypothetical protein EVG20_g10382 [Dentipellis fragilis]|uniref:Selenoprotein O n=1 Tax=Dentipellis fragilis TaxID=205917 RepID=A0A4Y9XRY1_9AGAM|nr:hypothetical protein EVG20_g10382 [Dentipellis fragilis]